MKANIETEEYWVVGPDGNAGATTFSAEAVQDLVNKGHNPQVNKV